jgi:hypothetical protein
MLSCANRIARSGVSNVHSVRILDPEIFPTKLNLWVRSQKWTPGTLSDGDRHDFRRTESCVSVCFLGGPGSLLGVQLGSHPAQVLRVWERTLRPNRAASDSNS